RDGRAGRRSVRGRSGGRRAAPSLRHPRRPATGLVAAGGVVVRLADLDGGGGADAAVRSARRGAGVRLPGGTRPPRRRGGRWAGRLAGDDPGVASGGGRGLAGVGDTRRGRRPGVGSPAGRRLHGRRPRRQRHGRRDRRPPRGSGPMVSGRAVGAAGGFLADKLLGEPRLQPHPVSAFGSVMASLERRLWRDDHLAGALHAAAGSSLGLVAGLAVRGVLGPGLPSTLAATYLSVAGRGLAEAATSVVAALEADDLDEARALLPALVG